MPLRVQILGATRLARAAIPYLLERRGARVVAVDPGADDETLPWHAPVRGLAQANGIVVGRVPADVVLDLDPDARATSGEGPMLRLLAPPGTPSPDVNRALLAPGDWEAVFVTSDGTAAWSRRPLDPPGARDADALLDHATLRALEALDEGWDAMVADATPVPLPHPLVGGRFRAQETFVSWEQPAARVAARIRACAGPWGGARTWLGETTVFLLDAKVVAEEAPAGHDAGTIVRVDDGLEVATGRGVIRVERLRPGWRPPRAAGEFAAEAGLSAGYQFV
jgi:hypothetical protein